MGGVLFILSPDTTYIDTDSIFQNNKAFYGGAISLGNPSVVTLTGTTFSENAAVIGGSILAYYEVDGDIEVPLFDYYVEYNGDYVLTAGLQLGLSQVTVS